MTSPSEVDHRADGLSEYERQILSSWSDTHKKSTLMLFVLLALSRGPAWSGDIHAYLRTASAGRLGVDEQSLHRALRRLEALNVLTHASRSVPGTGAKRKVYELTRTGERVLVAYLDTTMSYLGNPEFIASVRALAPSRLPPAGSNRDSPSPR